MSTRTTAGSRTHPLNVAYLVVGLVFLGLAGSWALREAGVVDLTEDHWILPLTLVVAGTIGLVAAAAKGLSRRDAPGVEARSYDDLLAEPSGDNHENEGDAR